MHAILREKGTAGPEVDAAADDVHVRELGPVRLARGGAAEARSVVAVVGPRLGLPAGQAVEGDFGVGKADADEAVRIIYQSWTTSILQKQRER